MNATTHEPAGLRSPTYWIANAMEMFERLAYYGLRVVVPVYMLLPVEAGGPEFDNIQKGVIFAWWAAVQSFVPVLSGGFADRFGYKKTVGVSIAIKIAGYLVMGFAVDTASLLTGGVSAATAGHPATYAVFCLGALLLALGTAVFKPGVQGIIATQMNDDQAAVGWAVFYQLVNVGGFLGPFLAGIMRLMAWKWVFISCAVIVAVNYLLLLTFPEPDKEVVDDEPAGVFRTLWDGVAGILEPRLLAFLTIFSGFWAMFYQLFDLLPNFIDHWVDSSGVYRSVAAPLMALFGGSPPEAWGGMVPQEFMINLNAGLIMLFAFAAGMVTSKLRSMTAMIVGIVVSAGGIALLATRSGWLILGAIAVFSVGEMLASPTKMRYVAGIAPPGKKALYLGYVNATTGIGWSLGSLIAGTMYEEQGDLQALGRRYLVSATEMAPDAAEALPKSDVIPTLAARLQTDVPGAVQVLWDTYDPWSIWPYFAFIGLVSMVGLVLFDAITRRDASWEADALALVTGAVSGLCYGPTVGIAFAVVIAGWHRVGARLDHEVGRPLAARLDANPVLGGLVGTVLTAALTAYMLVPPA